MARRCRALEFGQRVSHSALIARSAPGGQPFELVALGVLRHRHDRVDAAGERRGLGFQITVDAHHHLLAALDRFQPRGVGFDQLLLHVARLDRGHRAAHGVDARQFFLGLGLECVYLALDLGRAVEDVAIVEQVGLVGEDLLHA